jgi:uncharacterized protein YidB (DUF937 family)
MDTRLVAIYLADQQNPIIHGLDNLAEQEDLHEPSASNAWHPAIHLLDKVLKTTTLPGTELYITLSSNIARYAIIPWSEDLSGSAEFDAYVRHCISANYGEVAKSWHTFSQKGGYGEAAIASAIDQQLLDHLHRLADIHGKHLRRVSPFLSEALDMLTMTPDIKSLQDYWLVMVEPSRITVGMIGNHQWQSIRSQDIQQAVDEQIAVMIQRESILHGGIVKDMPILLSSKIIWTVPGNIAGHRVHQLGKHAASSHYPISLPHLGILRS